MLLRLNRTIIFVCISLFVLLLQPSFALDAETIANDEVIVEYERPLRVVAEEVVRMYPTLKRELEEVLDTTIDFRPTVRILKDRKAFKQIAGNSLVVAVAYSKIDLIVIDNSKMNTNPFTLEATLKHELCHLVLHHYVRPGRLPRWFNEGVSQWVSGGITDIFIGEDKDLLKQASLSGRFIRMKDLTDSFPRDNAALMLAYQQSKSLVNYIFQEFGSDRMLNILVLLRGGSSMDEAILKALALPMDDLESRWHSHLSRKFTWFTYLSSHLYQLLFTFAGLVVIYGFIKVIQRKRAYKDEEEDESFSE